MTDQEVLEMLSIIMAVVGVSIFLALVIPVFIYSIRHTITEDTEESKLAMFGHPNYESKRKTLPNLGCEDVDMESVNKQAYKLDLMALEAFGQMLKVSKKNGAKTMKK